MEAAVDLIIRARQGDRPAREALGAWCLKHAFRLAYLDLGSVPNRALVAEEIAGEASLKAITHLEQFEPGTRFEAWLHRIVRNCVHDHLRRGDHAVPPSVYERWVHDFLHAYSSELDGLIRSITEADPNSPGSDLRERIATDLKKKTYREFQRLSYEGRANAVLEVAQRWLREFVGLESVPLYEQDEGGEWRELPLRAPDETESAAVERAFVQYLNDRLAELPPLHRQLLRWYFLEGVPIAEIARREQWSERTTYRRLADSSASLRARLARDGCGPE